MTDSGSSHQAKALLLYDGECRFCCKWVERWKESGREIIEAASSQSGAGESFGFSIGEPLEAVQLIEKEGKIHSGAAAVFRLMTLCGSSAGSVFWWLYCHLAIFRFLTEWGYRIVADHRALFSLLTTLFWGGDVRKPSYDKASGIFLRLLALTYLAAFGGLWWQINGLIGPSGILPAAEFLPRAHAILGGGAYRELPTLFWMTGCSATALVVVCAAGTAVSLAALCVPFRFLFGAFFLVLEILYLSIVNVGQVFMGYQWDALLLEAGFLGIFLAPWVIRDSGNLFLPSHGSSRMLSSTARWLFVWLLFRLMFSSALVKWMSGDPAWRDFSALEYHFWTQPLPNPGGWLAGQFPDSLLRLMTMGMFVIEFGAPWLLFGPRNLRLLGAVMIALLQLLIALTGNYGFFNLLALALCVLVVDDRSWPFCFLTDRGEDKPHAATNHHLLFPAKFFIACCALLMMMVSLVPMPLVPKPALIISAYEALAPFHLVNGYGLFAVMTKQRHEIIVEGSSDGVIWKPYNFRFKPGNLHHPPPVVPLLMPRLDWQMWFASLGPVNESPWFGNFIVRLFQSDRAVLDLLAGDPFQGKSPRYLRARMGAYHFSTPGELRKDGLWWTSEPEKDYLPEVELRGEGE